MNLSDTIMAVSSPPGRGQRALLRLCGPDACGILGLDEVPRGTFAGTVPVGAAVCPVLFLVSRGPHSFSGEDMVELLMPGSNVLMDRIQGELLQRAREHSLDLRLAEPGEFTARAYFNGRIDLIQAEGIADAISARTDSQLRASSIMRSGRLSTIATDLGTTITRLAGLVEAGIDFTDEEDVVGISDERLSVDLEALLGELQSHLDRSFPAERLQTVPLVVLAGPPNAGKSTLFNGMLSRDRTVVAPVEGTTRDVIIEPLLLENGLEVMLADLAGLTDATGEADQVERAMQAQARDALARADLVIRCTPCGEEPSPLECTCPTIDVRTKMDLARGDVVPMESIPVCVPEGEGMNEVRSEIITSLGMTGNSLASGLVPLTQRHLAMLGETREALERTRTLLGEPVPQVELLAATLREALDALGVLVGRITPDDVLDEVFSRFCVGK